MSRLLRRNKPCRGCRDCHSTEKVHRDEEKDHRDEEEDYRDEEDGHDHRLDELRRALHHFTLGVEIPSDKSEEDDHPDEEECPELDLLREAMYLEAAYITSDEDESQDET